MSELLSATLSNLQYTLYEVRQHLRDRNQEDLFVALTKAQRQLGYLIEFAHDHFQSDPTRKEGEL